MSNTSLPLPQFDTPFVELEKFGLGRDRRYKEKGKEKKTWAPGTVSTHPSSVAHISLGARKRDGGIEKESEVGEG